MWLFALLIGVQVTVPESDRETAKTEVVVTARPLSRALSDCLARGCTPAEEVTAAMEAAADRFVAGRYDEAKQILRRTISRNKRHSAEMPGLMSDLYATYADVAQHFGDETGARRATIASVNVLKEELGESHPAVSQVSGRIGDMWVKLGDANAADRAYQEAAKTALRRGDDSRADMLTFRRAWIALSADNLGLARKLIGQIERERGGDADFAPYLQLLRARLALAGGDEGAIDAMVAAMSGAQSAEPVLVYSPPYPNFDAALRPGRAESQTVEFDRPSVGGATQIEHSIGLDVRWVDIGYWINPDGRTSGVTMLRPAKGSDWAGPIAAQIAARRYAAFPPGTRDVGIYRVERFTVRSMLDAVTGSRMLRRTGQPALQMVDLTHRARTGADTSPPP